MILLLYKLWEDYMNKKLIIGVIIAVIVAGGGYLVVNNSKDKDQNNSTSSQSTGDQKSSQSISNSTEEIKTEDTNAEKLAKSGKPQHCTFDYASEQSTAKGNMYTDGKGKSRMTIDAVKTAQGNSGTNDMIIRDNKYYSWITTAGQTIGFSGELGSQSGSQSSSSTAAPDKNFSMKCTGWTVDNSKFDVPTNVNFTSMNFTLPTGQ